MAYTDAIVFLKENNITKEDGSFYEFGDVSYVSPLVKLLWRTSLRSIDHTIVRKN